MNSNQEKLNVMPATTETNAAKFKMPAEEGGHFAPERCSLLSVAKSEFRRGKWFYACLLTTFLLLNLSVSAQNDVMMQGFNFNVPVDEANRNGFWWDNLAGKSQILKDAGFTGIWTPPPSKAYGGVTDTGYAVFDHFDLGNYNLRGTTETRYGSRTELENMIAAMHARGIEVYSDTVLHHLVTDYHTLEVNPAVKNYVASEANNGANTAFPTNEIVWRVPNVPPGDYYIRVKGYNLPCAANYTERAYEIYATWTNVNPQYPFEPSLPQRFPYNFENEPNDGNGMFTAFIESGSRIWAYIGNCNDVDEYRITLTQQADINIILTSMRGTGYELGFSDQKYGYRISRVTGPQGDLTASLQTLTYTHVDYQANNGVTHTGAGEKNWIWDYTYFHPNSNNDYLEYFDGTDRLIPHAKLFGNDIDTSDQRPDGGANRMIYWGQWLANQIGFDGYRMDAVLLYEEDFAASWINAMPRKTDGSQRFVVGEYASLNKSRIRAWVDALRQRGADAKVFDFNLKFDLNRLANGDSSFDMNALNHAGLVRDNTGNNIPSANVVTFAENHDTAQPSAWIYKDWHLPYAYILFAEGRPCIQYAHFFGTVLSAFNTDLIPPVGLQQDIRKLINIRRQQLEGDMTVLSEIGNPAPASDTVNVYVARRRGNLEKNRPGGILVINNSENAAKCLIVDNAPSGSNYENWSNKTLVDLTGAQPAVQVAENGRVQVCAAPRGYSIYTPVEWMNNRVSDFNRDGRADIAVFRPADGVWHILQNSSYSAIHWGMAGDRIVAGDYDGDRKTDAAVWRPSTGFWHILQSSNNEAINYLFGAGTDIPVPADYDGDGKFDIAVFRPSNGTWYIRNSSDDSITSLNWGMSEDVPVPADYDGDGRADVAVWRPSNGTWYLLQSGIGGFAATQFGQNGDKPVAADYDGDRKADIAVFRPSDGHWYRMNSSTGEFFETHFGISSDLPAPADYDADGKTDIAVYRDGFWYIQQSASGFTSFQFGAATDKPVPNAFVP